MRKRLLYTILLFSFIIADDQSPVFLPIESTEDFYSGSSIFLEVQVQMNHLLKIYCYIIDFQRRIPLPVFQWIKRCFTWG